MKFQTDLISLKKGDAVDHFLMIRRCDLKQTKSNKSFVNLDLGDKTIAFTANVWENFDELLPHLVAGTIIHIDGVIEEYQGLLQIKIEKIRLPKPSEQITSDFFLPHSKRNVEEMQNEFFGSIGSIKNEALRELLELLFSPENFEKFKRAPAGKNWHHSYIHGLLEHTLEIVAICKLMVKFHPELKEDLLIAGAMLHDYGKIEELTYESAFDYSTKGKLVGHIVLAAIKISEAMQRVPNFPQELGNQLLHLVLSHQGKLENASPVVPKTIEAITLYHADELSAQSNAYKSAVINDIVPQSDWTKYISLISTQLYKKEFNNQ